MPLPRVVAAPFYSGFPSRHMISAKGETALLREALGSEEIFLSKQELGGFGFSNLLATRVGGRIFFIGRRGSEKLNLTRFLPTLAKLSRVQPLPLLPSLLLPTSLEVAPQLLLAMATRWGLGWRPTTLVVGGVGRLGLGQVGVFVVSLQLLLQLLRELGGLDLPSPRLLLG